MKIIQKSLKLTGPILRASARESRFDFRRSFFFGVSVSISVGCVFGSRFSVSILKQKTGSFLVASKILQKSVKSVVAQLGQKLRFRK